MRIICINAKGVEDYMEVGEVFEVDMDKNTHWKITTKKGVSIVVEKVRFEVFEDNVIHTEDGIV